MYELSGWRWEGDKEKKQRPAALLRVAISCYNCVGQPSRCQPFIRLRLSWRASGTSSTRSARPKKQEKVKHFYTFKKSYTARVFLNSTTMAQRANTPATPTAPTAVLRPNSRLLPYTLSHACRERKATGAIVTAGARSQAGGPSQLSAHTTAHHICSHQMAQPAEVMVREWKRHAKLDDGIDDGVLLQLPQ